MFQPLSAFIGLRYTKAKRDNNYISFISLASVFGIALGVTVLITVLSIMNGYVKGIQDRHLGMLSHITVFDSDWLLPNWQTHRKQVISNQQVKAAAPFIEKNVLLKEGDKIQPTLLQGVIPELEKDIGTINQYIQSNKANHNQRTQASDVDINAIKNSEAIKPSLDLLTSGSYNIILGESLAKTFKLTIGDTVTMLSPKQNLYVVNDDLAADVAEDLVPIIQEFTIVATFKVDFSGYDSSFAYIHLEDAASLFDMGNHVMGLRAQITNIFDANLVGDQLAAASMGELLTTNWTKQHSSFFRALQLQKTMLFLVLLLIIGVAAFNLISTLIMVVTDKESDIAILRTLGMPPAQVMKVFVIQGALLAFIGTTIGVILGLLVASNISDIVQFLERTLDTQFLNGDIHGLTQIDAKIETLDVILIAISAFALSILATLFPAWKASKVQPAEALRYE